MAASIALQQLSRHIVRSLAYRVALNESSLEERLASYFPLEAKKLGVGIVLHNPKIRLNELENRIHLQLDLAISLPGNASSSGYIEMAGSLLYVAQEGAFYIDDPEICEFSVLSIPSRYLTPLRVLVRAVLTRYVANRPVFKFKEGNIKHRLAKAVFKTVEVHKGKLRVRFALN